MQDEMNANPCLIVILRALARIEAKLTEKGYEEVLQDYKQQIDDLETFYATG